MTARDHSGLILTSLRLALDLNGPDGEPTHPILEVLLHGKFDLARELARHYKLSDLQFLADFWRVGQRRLLLLVSTVRQSQRQIHLLPRHIARRLQQKRDFVQKPVRKDNCVERPIDSQMPQTHRSCLVDAISGSPLPILTYMTGVDLECLSMD